jgi:hypothetical protein
MTADGSSVIFGIVVGMIVTILGWLIISLYLSQKRKCEEDSKAALKFEIKREILHDCYELFERKKVI